MPHETGLSLAEIVPELAGYADWFDTFSTSYVNEETHGPLELKIQHTARVTMHARRIASSQALEPAVERATRLAAMFHDVGRFPQFARWRTFRDPDSANHGKLGASALREHHVLADETAEVGRLTLVAVALHNRYALPEQLDRDARVVTDIVRDADKIDILRIFSMELSKPEPSPDVVLHVAREPEQWSPAIADMLMEGRVPDYKELHFVNDFVMLLCSWLPELAFEESRKIVREAGTIEMLLDTLPHNPALNPVRERVRFLLRG